MYHMLKYNTTSLPDQALYCLRYYLLYDWHVCNEYSDLENNEDIDAKSFVHMFDNFRRNVEEDRRTWNSVTGNCVGEKVIHCPRFTFKMETRK